MRRRRREEGWRRTGERADGDRGGNGGNSKHGRNEKRERGRGSERREGGRERDWEPKKKRSAHRETI